MPIAAATAMLMHFAATFLDDQTIVIAIAAMLSHSDSVEDFVQIE